MDQKGKNVLDWIANQMNQSESSVLNSSQSETNYIYLSQLELIKCIALNKFILVFQVNDKIIMKC